MFFRSVGSNLTHGSCRAWHVSERRSSARNVGFQFDALLAFFIRRLILSLKCHIRLQEQTISAHFIR